MGQTVQRPATPTGATNTRVAGVTMAAGVAFAVGALGTLVTEWTWPLILVGFALLLYAVPKLHRMQAPADGWAGAWGSRLVLVGAGVMVALGVVYLVWEAVGDPGEPAWTEVVWLVGFAAFVLGIVLFAIGSALSARFTRAAPIVMLVGLVAAVAIDMATGAFFEEDPATRQWGFLIGVPAFGLALAWMGAAARSDNRPPTAAVRR